jgi:hypothetical protein
MTYIPTSSFITLSRAAHKQGLIGGSVYLAISLPAGVSRSATIQMEIALSLTHKKNQSTLN